MKPETEMKRISEQMVRTDHLIEMRMSDLGSYATGYIADPETRAWRNRLNATVRRMEGNQARREKRLDDLATRIVTGRKSFKAFASEVKGTYRPSVERTRFDAFAVRVFADAFARRFGRDVYLYG